LALLHLCDARDVHADNVVQTSAGPVPIDLECLWGGAEDGRMALDGVPIGSVAATAFLPYWVRTARGTWKNGGGVLSSVSSREEDATNRYAPVAAPPLPHGEAFRSGFLEMYRLAMSEAGREALMRCGHSCLGAERRRVLRATRVYGLLLQELDEAPPGLAERAAKLREIRERLSQVRTERPLDDEVLNAEVAALSRGDIPRFVSSLSPVDIARRASEVDLRWQLKLLEAWSPTDKAEVGTAERQLLNGWLVGPDGSQGWLGWEGSAGSAVRQLRWLPWTLYAGAVGPLLAMAVLQSAEQDGKAKRVLREALPVYRRAALEVLRQQGFRWGLEGLSGHFRAIEALCGLGVEEAGSLETVRQAWLAAALTADPIDTKVDFTTGLAGAVGPLCRYAQQSQDEGARVLVERLAALLMQSAPAMATDPSLAHGRAGVGLGLLEAGRFLGRPDWVSGGLALWSTPPVVESATLKASWCRGHAGIALSRWVALQRLPEHLQVHSWQQVLREAIPTLQGSAANARGATSALSLCCGTLGSLATLRVLGAAPSGAEWAAVGCAMTERGNQSPPGLWTGLAGLVVAQHAPVGILERLIA
jgi:lantibiotic modifying enzyme